MTKTIGRPFPKGVSGNPGGPPRGILTKVRESCGGDVVKILEVFRDLALGKVPAGYDAEIKTADRVRAGDLVLDRILGKAPQSIDLTDDRQRASIDLSKLTAEQLEALAAIPDDEPDADDPPAG